MLVLQNQPNICFPSKGWQSWRTVNISQEILRQLNATVCSCGGRSRIILAYCCCSPLSTSSVAGLTGEMTPLLCLQGARSVGLLCCFSLGTRIGGVVFVRLCSQSCLKGTICKIFVIRYPKTTCTVLYISCSCFQKLPRICKSREIPVLKIVSSLFLHGHGRLSVT